ncbi:Acetyl-CoA carboxylase [Trichinella papuae]|uniref:Acetyl-CoA carboxylase n=1 Tax=Trichinella papuae TaxID=268474 RepID=A0A0V1M249_9BILA|nr:Acetyl-CoA carboxylase [Trichinella papuae]
MESGGGCPVCKGDHPADRCPRFRSYSVQQRRHWAMRLKLCFVCLGQGHRRERCPKRKSSQFWNALLAGDAVPAGKARTKQTSLAARSSGTDSTEAKASLSRSENEKVENGSEEGTSPVRIHLSSTEGQTTIRLPVVRAMAHGEKGKTKLVNCLLDSGSERSLIRTNVADELDLQGPTRAMTVKGVNGLHVRIAGEGIELTALSLPSLCDDLVATPTPWPREVDLPREATLATPPSRTSIHVFIRFDMYYRVLGRGLRVAGEDDPIAVETIFRWILSGPKARCPAWLKEPEKDRHALHQPARVQSLGDHRPVLIWNDGTPRLGHSILLSVPRESENPRRRTEDRSLTNEPCIYFLWKSKNFLAVGVYVDDLHILSNNESSKNELKTALCDRFKMKDLESCKTLKVAHCRLTRSSTSRKCCTDSGCLSVLSRAMMPRSDGEIKRMHAVPYREVIGCLVYLSQSCQPDICHTVGIVSRFIDNPKKAHWTARTENALAVYSDADWINDKDYLRSSFGWVVCHSGAAKASSSKKTAHGISTGRASSARTRQIDIYFVKEKIQEGKIEMRQIPSADNAADMFTKALTPSRMAACVKLIRIIPTKPFVPASENLLVQMFKFFHNNPASMPYVGGVLKEFKGILVGRIFKGGDSIMHFATLDTDLSGSLIECVNIVEMGVVRGAWVVVDPSINSRYMEMYADSKSRGGVLEPEGTVEIKYREKDLRKTIKRCDPICQSLLVELKGDNVSDELRSELEEKLRARIDVLLPIHHSVAVQFADLHDRAGRMLAKKVISKVVDWKTSRCVFYWRLRRRLAEEHIKKLITEHSFDQPLNNAQMNALLQHWFDSDVGNQQNQNWADDQITALWFESQIADEQQQSIVREGLKVIQHQQAKNKIKSIFANCPGLLMETAVELVKQLDVGEQDELLKLFMHHASGS